MFNVVMINFALPGKRVFYMVFLFLLFGFLNANAVVVMVDAKDVFSDGFGEKCSRFIFYENNTHSINVNALFFERKGVFFFKGLGLGGESVNSEHLLFRELFGSGDDVEIKIKSADENIGLAGRNILKNVSFMMSSGLSEFLGDKSPMPNSCYSASDISMKLLNISAATGFEDITGEIPVNDFKNVLADVDGGVFLFFIGKSHKFVEEIGLLVFEVFYAVVALSKESYMLVNSESISFVDREQLFKLLDFFSEHGGGIRFFLNHCCFSKEAGCFLDPRLNESK